MTPAVLVVFADQVTVGMVVAPDLGAPAGPQARGFVTQVRHQVDRNGNAGVILLGEGVDDLTSPWWVSCDPWTTFVVHATPSVEPARLLGEGPGTE